MRWDYTSPAGKLFLLDGKYGWFYSRGDSQVQRIRRQTTGRPALASALPAGPHGTGKGTEQPDAHHRARWPAHSERPAQGPGAACYASHPDRNGRRDHHRNRDGRDRRGHHSLHVHGRNPQRDDPSRNLSLHPAPRRPGSRSAPARLKQGIGIRGPGISPYFPQAVENCSAGLLAGCPEGLPALGESVEP